MDCPHASASQPRRWFLNEDQTSFNGLAYSMLMAMVLNCTGLLLDATNRFHAGVLDQTKFHAIVGFVMFILAFVAIFSYFVVVVTGSRKDQLRQMRSMVDRSSNLHPDHPDFRW